MRRGSPTARLLAPVERPIVVVARDPDARQWFHAPGGYRGLIVRPSAVRGRSTVGSRGPPIVALDSLSILMEGDAAIVDGDRGEVVLPDVDEVPVVTAFLERPDGRVLLLKRSDRVGSFRGRWAAISGYLEEGTAEAQALREIREETGIEPRLLTLARAGSPIPVRSERTVFVVHPYRFRVDAPTVRLDWEHTESVWVDPSEIARRETVPSLDRAWRAVAGRADGLALPKRR